MHFYVAQIQVGRGSEIANAFDGLKSNRGKLCGILAYYLRGQRGLYALEEFLIVLKVNLNSHSLYYGQGVIKSHCKSV